MLTVTFRDDQPRRLEQWVTYAAEIPQRDLSPWREWLRTRNKQLCQLSPYYRLLAFCCPGESVIDATYPSSRVKHILDGFSKSSIAAAMFNNMTSKISPSTEMSALESCFFIYHLACSARERLYHRNQGQSSEDEWALVPNHAAG